MKRPNITPRESLPAAKLYALLLREFEKTRRVACAKCLMPLPFYRAPVDAFTANWHIGTPRWCRHGCHRAMAEILARLWTRYDLKVPVERRGVVRPARKFDRPLIQRPH